MASLEQRRQEARRRRILRNAEQRLEKVLGTQRVINEDDLHHFGSSAVGESTDKTGILTNASDQISIFQSGHEQREEDDQVNAIPKEGSNGKEAVSEKVESEDRIVTRDSVSPDPNEDRPRETEDDTQSKLTNHQKLRAHDDHSDLQGVKSSETQGKWWMIARCIILAMLATFLVCLYHFELLGTVPGLKETSFLVYFGLLEIVLFLCLPSEIDNKKHSFTVGLLFLAIRLCGVHKEILDSLSKLQAVSFQVTEDLIVFIFCILMLNIFIQWNCQH